MGYSPDRCCFAGPSVARHKDEPRLPFVCEALTDKIMNNCVVLPFNIHVLIEVNPLRFTPVEERARSRREWTISSCHEFEVRKRTEGYLREKGLLKTAR